MKRKDAKITAIDDQAFETAKETRALMLKTLEKLQGLNTLNSAAAQRSLTQAAGDASGALPRCS